MNAFFIHTPFQLLVAHNLIHSKQLNNNVLFIFYNTNNISDQLYSQIIKSYWDEVIIVGDINFINLYYKTNLISYYFTLKGFLRKMKFYLENVDSFYFGDIRCLLYIFLSKIYIQSNKVYFFEEGLGHYSHDTIMMSSFKTLFYRIYGILVDLVIFKPLAKVSMRRALFVVRGELLPGTSKRFSILDYYHSSKDELLILKPLTTQDKVVEIEKESMSIAQLCNGQYKVLFAVQPEDLRFIFGADVDLYLEFENYLKAIKHKNPFFIIKKHHRNTNQEISKYTDILSQYDISYYLFPEGINSPLEILVPYLKVDELLTFYSSCSVYLNHMNIKVTVLLIHIVEANINCLENNRDLSNVYQNIKFFLNNENTN